ncbi:hypothetical protein ILYODFUR_035491 [Ilyodon furcidens]|uniref:Uncharacterized protein n=1 Tax=Ilyodon furcidens TaxID=33524 RepID=A0ABV0VBN1_9TELE
MWYAALQQCLSCPCIKSLRCVNMTSMVFVNVVDTVNRTGVQYAEWDSASGPLESGGASGRANIFDQCVVNREGAETAHPSQQPNIEAPCNTRPSHHLLGIARPSSFLTALPSVFCSPPACG